MSGTCCRLAVCAPSSTPQGPRVNTVELPSRPPDSIQLNVLCSGRSVSCILNFKLTGMALEQLQEVFGPLVTEQLNSMEWAPTKREAEPSSAPSDRSNASRTEQGKVATGPRKQTTLAQRWGKGTPFRWPQSDLSDQGVGQAGATAGDGAQDPQAGLQLGTLRPTRQSGTLLFAAAQKWKKSQQEGATTTALRDPNAAHGPEGHRRCSAHTIPDQSRGDEVAQGRQLVLPEVVPGAGEPSDRRRQAPTSACKASGSPATGTSHNPAALHDPRFHATRPLAGNMTGVTAFQLDVSNRTKGHNTVWECLEALTGLSALQIIGLQLRRDTLKQSPAATLVQQALAEYS